MFLFYILQQQQQQQQQQKNHETFHVFQISRIIHYFRALKYVAPPPYKIESPLSGYYHTFYLLDYSTLKS